MTFTSAEVLSLVEPFSPLILALVGLLAAAFLTVTVVRLIRMALYDV